MNSMFASTPTKLLAGAGLLFTTLAAITPISEAWANGVLGPSPETTAPVNANPSAAPLVMLTMARDHTLFFPAYDDMSDINDDGIIDYRFKPGFEYLGLYNPYYCYSYSSTGNIGLFSPAASAVATTVNGKSVPGPCVASGQSSHWSGNFLNYVTTSRIDALRVVLYGGYREIDTDSSTVLRRAYIPQDGHAWAKEYTSTAVDGYDISRYTPLAQPLTNLGYAARHFFGNLTSTLGGSPNGSYTYSGTSYPPKGESCKTLSTCSNYPPLMRVITNSDMRVWQWASSQRPVLNDIAYPKLWSNTDVPSYGKGSLSNYAVRVAACTAGYTSGCKAYVSGGTTTNKPTGVLHDYGADGGMYFGLLTGSYDTNMSGGRLRKNISSFASEVNENGTFNTGTANSLVKQINNIRIRNFNNLDLPANYFENFVYKNGNSERGNVMTQGTYGDWGNPMAEMMYESLRYFSGEKTATGSFDNNTTTDDEAVGLDKPAWVDPYSTSNWCAKPSIMAISSTNPSFDSDQLPGSYFSKTFTGTLADIEGTELDVNTLTSSIGVAENINGKSYVIGEAGATRDWAPTAKTVSQFGELRGLPPDETNSEGSFYAAAVANFGRSKTLRKIGDNQVAFVDTYAIALNAPLMKITIPWSGVSIIPFARSISDNTASTSGTIDATGSYQPTNQIVGGYIQAMTVDLKNKKYYLKFIVNFEDSAWGNDFEMDVMAEYEITADGRDTTVKVRPVANVVGGIAQNMGYTISGVNTADGTTIADGVYLVTQSAYYGDNGNNYIPYFLNVPDGNYYAKACESVTNTGCGSQMPYPLSGTSSTKNFKASNTASAYLNDPLYYAAKWGGYRNDNSPPTAATAASWVVDTYARVTSAAKLRSAFATALQNVMDRSGTSGSVATSSQQVQTDTKVFRASFNAKNGTGELSAIPLKQTLDANTRVQTAQQLEDSASWIASNNIPAPYDRKILFKPEKSSYLFELSGHNLAAFTTLNDWKTEGDKGVIDYWRGDQSKEVSNNGTYRSRNSILGSIVNSAPYYSADTKMVYVGANDGMLHGFDSETGVEKFAYVPSSVLPYIYDYSNVNWSHRYLVDGNIAMSEQRQLTDGKNYLVAMMGRASKGLFGLEIEVFGKSVYPSFAWENFGAGDGDMGYLTGSPVIAYLHADGTPVVIFGNGYNSDNQQAVLYVLRLSDGELLAKFSTRAGSSGTPNGLATPGLRLDSNGKVEYAYAGDYLGNVWRFDLSSLNNSSNAASLSGTKIFTAVDSNGVVKHITGPVAVSYSYNSPDSTEAAITNKWYIFFGTGSILSSTDAEDTKQQTFYGLIDQGAYTLPTPVSDLVERKQDATGTAVGLTVRSFVQPGNSDGSSDMKNKKGWYLNWPLVKDKPSERVVSTPVVYNGWIPTVLVSSIIPQTVGCVNNDAGYLNAFDAYRGGGLAKGFFDLDGDKNFLDDEDDYGTLTGDNKVVGGIDFGIGNISAPAVVGNFAVVQGTNGSGNTPIPPNTVSSRRISWRELVAQ